MKMFFPRLSILFFLALFAMEPVLAGDSVARMISESIYLLELLVIALVTIALIIVTVSIAKSRRGISKVVTDIREEMSQERAMLTMTMRTVKEKEKQISYMAHLLQTHLEGNEKVGEAAVDSEYVKKKVTSDEILVEVIDSDELEQQVNGSVVDIPNGVAGFSTNSSSTNKAKVDPRFVSADGSVKRAHFGPDQYLAEVGSYQHQIFRRVQSSVKQADQYLSDTLDDIRLEKSVVKTEREKINDFVKTIKSNIRSKDTQRMNAKDSNIIKQLNIVDGRLEALEASLQEIEACYVKVMNKVGEYVSESVSESTEEEQVNVA